MNEKGSKVHIAIVDDDALVRESLCDCVESAGYSAEGFASAEGLLASNSGGNAACLILDMACLILDIQLPGISGLELQRRLGDGAGPPGRIRYCQRNGRESRSCPEAWRERLPV
jgi:FixJ family two-component response regulator